jgi:hypothetical protein
VKLNIWPNVQWQSLCDQVAINLGFDLSRQELRLVPTIQQALMDSVYGLRRLSAIKKKVFYIKDLDCNFTPAITALAKEGLELQPLGHEVLTQPELLSEKLGRDTLLFLYSADDPILGLKYDTNKLDLFLQEQTVFVVRMSYRAHLYSGLIKPHKNFVHLMATDSDLCVMSLGERVRFSTSGTEFCDWSQVNLDFILSQLKTREESKNKIIDFERSSPAGGKSIFLERPRYYDRAILTWDNIDGEAIIERLTARLNLKLKPPGLENRFESLSLTRWGGVRPFEYLLAQGLTPEEQRGTVLIAKEAINEELKSSLNDVCQGILKDQGILLRP